MKKTILFLLFFSIKFFYSQPSPPPLFKVRYTLFDVSKNNFLDHFDIVATRLSPSFALRGFRPEFNGNVQVRDVDSNFFYIYLYSEELRLSSEKSDMMQLSIQQKKTGKIMSIFIPADYISKEMRIDNLRFMEGNYLYGLETPDEKYKGLFMLDNRRNYNLSISDLESHRISPEHLHTILTEICQKD
ncbi:hypothetical protein [uncultured Chryseobacterium sp.]|uniref:hypothetical protein n=1 Tax=uncultured Chryseobacterium sp. TaxID=259322 RepID=UPI0025D355FD|nr:hypothetical protein [uncultured Chryseobacterium sp.]